MRHFFPWQYIHVLVCPKREVKRFADLSSDETSDLWVTAKEVGARLEKYHKASSLTFAIQVWSALQFYCCLVLILSVLNNPNLLWTSYLLCILWWQTWSCLLTNNISLIRMVQKLAKQFHMSTFMSSRGRKGISRKMMKYMMLYVA
jgi:hypothetical protein